MKLKSRYGDKYRISREKGAEANDTAGFIVRCKNGRIPRRDRMAADEQRADLAA
jgi:hypothetical protein